LAGKIPEKKKIETPVSHIDLFSTILDYLNAKEFNKSDGRSLRRFIEKKSYNKYSDEHYAVVELDGRTPVGGGKLSKYLGSQPNFMIRKDKWK